MNPKSLDHGRGALAPGVPIDVSQGCHKWIVRRR